MAEGKLDLEIVTPKGRALSVSVDEVTAPGAAGEFGVMPGHVPLLAAIRTGIVSYRKGQDTKRFAVGTGFAEANAEKVLILTDEFVERDTIDPVKVRKDFTEAEAEFAKLSAEGFVEGEGVDARRELIVRLNWLVTQLELCGEAPAATVRLLEEAGVRDTLDVTTEEAEAKE